MKHVFFIVYDVPTQTKMPGWVWKGWILNLNILYIVQVTQEKPRKVSSQNEYECGHKIEYKIIRKKSRVLYCHICMAMVFTSVSGISWMLDISPQVG